MVLGDGAGMDISFLQVLFGLVGLTEGQHQPEILGTLLSFAFMGLIFLARFIFPIFGLLSGDRPASLLRRAIVTGIIVAVACACWLVPIFSVVDQSLVPVLIFGAFTFVMTAAVVTSVLGLIGAVLMQSLAHTVAAIVPEHPKGQMGSGQGMAPHHPPVTGGPVTSPSPLQDVILTGFNTGMITPVIAVVACGVAYGVSEIAFGPLGFFGGAGVGETPGVTTLNDGVAHGVQDVFGHMGPTLGLMAVMLVTMGGSLLAASRYAARRGIHFEGDPWARFIRPLRYKQKEANAWRELDAAVERHRARQ
jgi:hypothetical protein